MLYLNRTPYWLLALGLLVALVGCASRPALTVDDMHPPRVGTPSPEVSFWRETVSYPFPVHYARGTDDRGIAWEIAYMDEYAGAPQDKPAARTLVLVHGKGADSGYWSTLMKDALEAGLRVVAVDLPFYGKSIPGNLANPRGRTLQDAREAIYEVLVEQLGIERATYLGHSLGAQWVLGFALAYPAAVEKLILEDAGAFETYPRSLTLPGGELPWMDPSYAHDYAQWEAIWEPAFHRLASERAKTPEELEAFHFFKKIDESGQLVDAEVGFYLVRNTDSEYQNAARIGMIFGPEAEFEAWNIAYNRDVYTQGIELLSDDPGSIPARIGEIKSPMLILYGELDPFLPATIVTGNTDIRLDLIKPAYEKIIAAGGPPPVVKFYENAAHFPHIDQAARFNADVIDFIYGARVQGAENPADYQAPPVELPADIQAFVSDFVQALNSGDAERIMPFYSEEFRADGRDYAQTRAIYEQYGAMTAGSWEMNITAIEVDGDVAELDGTLSNQFISGSLKGHKLRKENGEWKLWGKQ